MFTIIDNYKKLMVSLVTAGLEGNLQAFDADGDMDISAEEVKDLLEQSPEAREAVDLAEVETLEAAIDLMPSEEIETSGNEKTIEQKTLQYIATKILKLRGETVHDGSIDGDIGRNSIKDIAAATGIDITGTVITGNIISKLTK